MAQFPLTQKNIEDFVRFTKDTNPIHYGYGCIASAFHLETLAYGAAILETDVPVNKLTSKFKQKTYAADAIDLTPVMNKGKVVVDSPSFLVTLTHGEPKMVEPEGTPFAQYDLGSDALPSFSAMLGFDASKMFAPAMTSYALLQESQIEDGATVVYTTHSISLNQAPRKHIDFYNLGTRSKGDLISLQIAGVEGSNQLFYATLRLAKLE